MFEVLVGLIVLPTAIIFLWNWLLVRMNAAVWDAYRYTGLIGTPIHELSHAVACVLFGMKIESVSFYSPNPLTGQLGYVRFVYRTHSALHALGRVIQGVAPLITASVILVMVFSLGDQMGKPGSLPLHLWVMDAAQATLTSARDMFLSGWQGMLTTVVCAILALHLIPSVSDIQISLGGLVGVLFAGLCVLLGLDLLQMNLHSMGLAKLMGVNIHYALGVALDWTEAALWMGVLGVTATVVMALIGSAGVILVPSIIGFGVRYIRGARGAT